MLIDETEKAVQPGWRVLFRDMDTCPNVSEFLAYVSQVARLGDLQTNHPPLLRFGHNKNMYYVHVTGIPDIKDGTFNLHCVVMLVDGPNPSVGANRKIVIEGYNPIYKTTHRILCRNR